MSKIGFLMTTFVYCKSCNEKIYANPPKSNVQLEGNVKYNNVNLDGNSINFGAGGELNFGPGGSVNFIAQPNPRIKCPKCGQVFDYSIHEFHEE